MEYIIEQAALKQAELKKDKNLTEENRQKLEFYQAVQIAMQGVIEYAQNFSKKAAELAEKEHDPFRKENFQKIAEVCSRVPAKPARTFREAINSIWIVQVAIHAENINMAMSPGRLDQILYRFYKEDIDNLNKQTGLYGTGARPAATVLKHARQQHSRLSAGTIPSAT